jgi:hypothetical protein
VQIKVGAGKERKGHDYGLTRLSAGGKGKRGHGGYPFARSNMNWKYCFLTVLRRYPK